MNREKLDGILAEILPEFTRGGLNCAESVLLTMCRYWEMDAPFAPQIATAFGGGMAAQRDVCGCCTGALMVIGLRLGRDVGGNRGPCYTAAQTFLKWMDAEYGTRLCGVLIDQDPSRPETMHDSRAKGGKHESVCRPLIRRVCEYLVENIE